MNPLLKNLQPYPFERLRQLFKNVTPSPHHTPISLGIGEPKHPTPPFIKEALCDHLGGLASYPTTAGDPLLRGAMSSWIERRYGLTVDPHTNILPVNGSREALFAFAQVVIDARIDARSANKQAQNNEQNNNEPPLVVCPNPFYQIYEGAALLAGAQTYYVNADPAHNFAVDWDSVPDHIWQRTQLLYVCSPGNPTGAVMPFDQWQKVFALSQRFGFVIASDECYSEIYFQGEPPLGALQAAHQCGLTDFKNLMVFTSLSKRSNVPGMRSGFCVGDANLIAPFLLYRTYHGCAMSGAVQAASRVAWEDEAHVNANRRAYRAKFDAVLPLLTPVLDVKLPDAAFYLWAGIPPHVCGGDDERFAAELLAACNVTVLPGSYLARANTQGINPGKGRVRMALVAEITECRQAAERIQQFVLSHSQ